MGGRTPIDVEVPFDMVIGGRVVRGRIDAIFADDDGGATRGGLEDRGSAHDTGSQAARGCSAGGVPAGVGRVAGLRRVESVRAAFHYVRSGADRRSRGTARQ